ncbi:hypothetical protein T261_7602 [Streptomyces lydicus]|nr:hypothetical protein T261_7602 [Streptomyces lydicus]
MTVAGTAAVVTTAPVVAPLTGVVATRCPVLPVVIVFRGNEVTENRHELPS